VARWTLFEVEISLKSHTQGDYLNKCREARWKVQFDQRYSSKHLLIADTSAPAVCSNAITRNSDRSKNIIMGDFGELVLIIGDFHIPHRASGIPDKFQRMFVPNKMQHVLCTGNLSTKEQYDELRSLAPNVHVVRGSFDDNTSFPDTKVIQIGQFKVGLVSGHQIVPWGDLQSLSMVLVPSLNPLSCSHDLSIYLLFTQFMMIP
jgi:Calcineurin-like phosphoesterase superfamily domain